jgi:protein tyrosine phosphatase (PTP) superfamily phosphohydrolase (DUF442 family)
MPLDRRTFALALGASASPWAQAQGLEAPNVVPIRPTLWTSGQPKSAALGGLRALGFEAVLYLAPFTMPDAVREEPDLLARQGIAFANVPIPFNAPTESHVQEASAVLQRWQGRQVLVHCQVNMRASTVVFLHRVIQDKESPELAWQSVTRVWSPEGAWKRLVSGLLAKHGVAFDPF